MFDPYALTNTNSLKGTSPMTTASATSAAREMDAKHSGGTKAGGGDDLCGDLRQHIHSSIYPRSKYLLDLPVDILQAIIAQIKNNCDLTALARTNTVLHALVTPYIYAKFDIVWPDAASNTEQLEHNRNGVDALTHGLATLVMDGRSTRYPTASTIWALRSESEHRRTSHQQGAAKHQTKPHRVDNHLAQHTRIFSIGNGPKEWIQECSINREHGKMLGTLVALAVQKMHKLESFHWDMPTGVLSDVWLALASLADGDQGTDCRLKSIWVRWHDNRRFSPNDHGASPGSLYDSASPILLRAARPRPFHVLTYPKVECPTFSVLPPLKSLTVLDIDEMSYVEEMSVLVEQSVTVLRELRVGVASHAVKTFRAKSGRGSPQVAGSQYQRPRTSSFRGGLLGVLFSLSSKPSPTVLAQAMIRHSPAAELGDQVGHANKSTDIANAHQTVSAELSNLPKLSVLLAEQITSDPNTTPRVEAPRLNSMSPSKSAPNTEAPGPCGAGNKAEQPELEPRKLQLEVLELERVYMSRTILCTAIDWSRLRSLVILGCQNCEGLWRSLRKTFAPDLSDRNSKSLVASPLLPGFKIRDSPRRTWYTRDIPRAEYTLRLTKLHTDNVSPVFLAFIRDCLPPDTLESLFLHQRATDSLSTVTVDLIFKCAIRRHRGSLKRLMVHHISELTAGFPTVWQPWIFSREGLTYITNGSMQLRELSIAISHRDWHHFLRRLPEIPSIRSLHIANLVDYPSSYADVRELAQQIVDVVAVRPELQLCFVGILNTCFQIVELSDDDVASYTARRLRPTIPQQGGPTLYSEGNVAFDAYNADDGLDDESDIEIWPTQGDQGSDVTDGVGSDEDDEFGMLSSDDTDEELLAAETAEKPKRPIFKLREILFYDEKIAIFKARHGKL